MTGNVHLVSDSDVNDVLSNVTANNDIDNAQVIANPAIIKGYVTESPTGDVENGGNFVSVSDEFDVFSLNAFAGQNLLLEIADYDVDNVDTVDLDLALLDPSGNLIAVSELFNSPTESITIPSDGAYFIAVRAFTEGSNYTLTVSSELSSTSYTQVTLNNVAPNEVIIVGDLSDQAATALAAAADRDDLNVSPKDSLHRGSTLKINPETLFNWLPSDVQKKSKRVNEFSMSVAPRGEDGVVQPASLRNAIFQQQMSTLRAVKALNAMEGRDVVKAREYPRPLGFSDPDIDPFLQWNMSSVGWAEARALITQAETDRGAAFTYRPVIAVIDSGVFGSHPDLASVLADQRDFVPSEYDGDGFDAEAEEDVDAGEDPVCHGFHGTHVATTAAAPENDFGIIGVAPFADVHAIKVGYSREDARFDDPAYLCKILPGDIAQSIRYAAGLSNASGELPPRRADVINMSLGSSQEDPQITQAVQDARAAGVIVVAAAGNDGDSSLGYPASSAGVISVASTDINNERSYFSQFNSAVDIAAPGGDATEDKNLDGYPDGVVAGVGVVDGPAFRAGHSIQQGTSMASPHAAAGFAMMRRIAPDITPDEIDAFLMNGDLTIDIGEAGKDASFGYGLMSLTKMAQAALSYSSGGGVPAPDPTLIVSPTRLDFGDTLSSITVNVSQAGVGDISVTGLAEQGLSVDPVGNSWISYAYDGSAANGLGPYTIVVDRDVLPDGVYTGTIFFNNSLGGQTPLPVSVYDRPVSSDAESAPIYILFFKEDDLEELQLTEQVNVVDGVGGALPASTLEEGSYVLYYGTDIDNDNLICDAGELCGVFPVEAAYFGSVLELTSDITDLELAVGVGNTTVATNSLDGAPRPERRAIPRRKTSK